jgi:4-amino-4-deoxy-L-arabinose transferase-like glycosyltransferase
MKQGVQPSVAPHTPPPESGVLHVDASSDRRPAALSIAVAAFVLLAQVLWFSWNRAPMLWDDSMYAAGALELYDAMDAGGLYGIAERFIQGPAGAKAPLICLLPVPLFLVFGRGSEWAFQSVELIAFAVLCFAAYRLVRKLSDGFGAFITVVLLSFMPLVAGLTRQFLIEVPLLATVVLWHQLLFRSEFLQRKGDETKLGMILGCGMLLKVTFPLFILGSLVAGAALHLRRPWPQGLWKRIAVTLVLGSLIASVWYGPNLVPLLQFAWSTSFGALALHYDQPLATYIAQIFSFGFSNLQLALVAVAAGLVVFVRKNPTPAASDNSEDRSFRVAALFAIFLWLALPLAVFLVSHDRIVRLTLPCLAVLPVVGGLLGSELRRRSPRVFTAWAAAAVLLGAALFCSFSFGIGPVDRLAAGPLVFWGKQLDWDQGRPDPVAWPHRSIVRAAAMELGGASGSTVFLLTNQSHLNWLNLKLAALQERIPMNFDFSGAYADPETAAKRAQGSPLVFVQEGGGSGPEWTEATGREVFNRLSRGGLGRFVHVYQALLPDGGSLHFYRNAGQDSNKAVEPPPATRVRFGDAITLVGFDLQRDETSLRWRAEWQVERDLKEDYAVYLHFKDAEGRLFPRDYPLGLAQKKSRELKKGERLTEEHMIPLTPDIRDLRVLHAGVYKLATFEKLPVAESAMPVVDARDGIVLNPLP